MIMKLIENHTATCQTIALVYNANIGKIIIVTFLVHQIGNYLKRMTKNESTKKLIRNCL